MESPLNIIVTASGGVIQEVYCNVPEARVFVLDLDELKDRHPEADEYDCWIPSPPEGLSAFRRDWKDEIAEHVEVARLADAADPEARSLVGASWGHFGPNGCP